MVVRTVDIAASTTSQSARTAAITSPSPTMIGCGWDAGSVASILAPRRPCARLRRRTA
jgi:hypothetical protein